MNNKYYIEIDNNKIIYSVRKSKRKTIAITVDINGDVKVSAPLRVSDKYIRELVQKKSSWIVKKLNEVTVKKSNIIDRKYENGEKILYLGKEYTLKIIGNDESKYKFKFKIANTNTLANTYSKAKASCTEASKTKVIKTNDTVEVYISKGLTDENSKQVVKEALTNWYRHSFAEISKNKINEYSLQLKAFPCKVVIKNQKTLWGSCSKKGNINLNWRLIMAPMDVIDYVIVHELCHLKFMNHSKDFWSLVESVLVDYRNRRNWLKSNGHKLVV